MIPAPKMCLLYARRRRHHRDAKKKAAQGKFAMTPRAEAAGTDTLGDDKRPSSSQSAFFTTHATPVSQKSISASAPNPKRFYILEKKVISQEWGSSHMGVVKLFGRFDISIMERVLIMERLFSNSPGQGRPNGLCQKQTLPLSQKRLAPKWHSVFLTVHSLSLTCVPSESS